MSSIRIIVAIAVFSMLCALSPGASARVAEQPSTPQVSSSVDSSEPSNSTQPSDSPTEADASAQNTAKPADAAATGKSDATNAPAKPATTGPTRGSPIPPELIEIGKISREYNDLSQSVWWSIPFPGAGNTLCQDCEIRRVLADHNIGIGYQLTSDYSENLAKSSVPPGMVVFQGQKPYWHVVNSLELNYNIPSQRLQFFGEAQSMQVSWEPAGPTSFRLCSLGISKGFLENDRIRVTVGQWANDLTFYEAYIGGNLASGVLGMSAAVPFLVGENREFLTSPGLMVDFKFAKGQKGGVGFNAKGLYNRFGVQRSTDPWGATYDHKHNPEGFRLWWKGLKPLFIEESGYHRQASPGKKDIFVRADGWYNMTHYPDYRTEGYGTIGPYGAGTGAYSGMINKNAAGSLAGDLQLLQTNKYLAYQGWYVGGSAQYAPQNENVITQYYEARLWSPAPFKSRPLDMLTVSLYHEVFSRQFELGALRAGLAANGVPPSMLQGMAESLLPTQFYGDQTAINAMYTIRLMRGVMLSQTLGYFRHGAPGPRGADNPVLYKAALMIYAF